MGEIAGKKVTKTYGKIPGEMARVAVNTLLPIYDFFGDLRGKDTLADRKVQDLFKLLTDILDDTSYVDKILPPKAIIYTEAEVAKTAETEAETATTTGSNFVYSMFASIAGVAKNICG